ncbi:unnamed protein product, partial [Laminaria digitata]
FLAQCSCPEDDSFFSASSRTEDCMWIGVEIQYINLYSTTLDDDTMGLCLAKTFYLTSPVIRNNDLFDDDSDSYYRTDRLFSEHDCWANNPTGTETITIVAFVLAVVGQLVEGCVAWRYFTYPGTGPALMTAGSVFEAAGVVAVSATLINLPSFGERGDDWVRGGLHTDQQALYGLAVTAATCAGLGALAVIIAGHYLPDFECDCRSSWNNTCRFHMLHDDRNRKHFIYYLGAFASAAIWLGAAVIEVVIATFLVWKSEGKARLSIDEGDWGVFGTSLTGLLVTEVLAFLVMW